MLSVKIRFILPVVQVALAILLMVLARREMPPQHYCTVQMPTVGLVCMGINAPATLFRFAVGAVLPLYKLERSPRPLPAFGTEQLLFLGAVIALWYVVGRWLDKRLAGKMSTTAIRRWPGVLVGAGLALFGVPLVVIAVEGIQSCSSRFGTLSNPLGSLTAAMLALAWGMTLTVVSIVRITKAIRMRARM